MQIVRQARLGVIFTCCLSFQSWAQDKATQSARDVANADKMALLMQDKLDASQDLLAAVSRTNYPQMIESLKRLDQIAKDATWQSVDTKDYQYYSKSFQNSVAEMLQKAEGKDLTQIAIPYVRLNLSCMECHHLVRSEVYKSRRNE